MKHLILLILLFVMALGLQAQESSDYHPFIEEGKRWLTGRFPDGNPIFNAFGYSSFSFEGDTIVSGQFCRKWVKRSWNANKTEKQANIDFVLPVFEENRQVWFFPKGQVEPLLMYDFRPTTDTVTVNSPQGDKLCYVLQEIKDGDTVSSLRKYYFRPVDDKNEYPGYYDEWIADDYNYWYNYWIEGIGSHRSPDFIARMDLPGGTDILLECSVGEEILYLNPTWAEKTSVLSPSSTYLPSTYYDLQGRRLSVPPAKGVYVENGRLKIKN